MNEPEDRIPGAPGPEGTFPGEREWRAWLDAQERPDKDAWIALLAGEADQWLAKGEPGPVVRLLETAVMPSSPVFSDLTSGPAKDLAGRLESLWRRARLSNAESCREWQERFDDVLDMLRHWRRYRRVLEKGHAEVGKGALSGESAEPESFDRYYQEWVLTPFRENVLRILEARGLSRRRFCETVGMSEAYLSQILNGRRTPTLKKLADISWALRTEFWRLFAQKGRLTPEEGTAWNRHWRPEPGDEADWKPGTANRPYDALERHFKLVFYPGPDLPGEKIPARSHLVVNPKQTELAEGQRYVLESGDGSVFVASYVGQTRNRTCRSFAGLDGRYHELPADPDQAGDKTAVAGPVVLGALMAVLIE